ncbi:hypothetical protein Ga0466249_004807 [Sporomusaceae bacterium BoRhaA]|uniref:hypothetical protein n=1 Tax=Pelorhabdus rhamnosifermentans TaxID=2772457 RepID=UPI001C063AC9|nr:hypothetical protein [Pelorhabdus rhamnosifermentans]MBU2703659.1 hypothetical protein [Pelorhabdus rhamnosifermentans]
MSLDDYGFSDYWITGDPNMLAPVIRNNWAYEKVPYDPSFEQKVRDNERYDSSVKWGNE